MPVRTTPVHESTRRRNGRPCAYGAHTTSSHGTAMSHHMGPVDSPRPGSVGATLALFVRLITHPNDGGPDSASPEGRLRVHTHSPEVHIGPTQHRFVTWFFVSRPSDPPCDQSHRDGSHAAHRHHMLEGRKTRPSHDALSARTRHHRHKRLVSTTIPP